LNESGRGHEKVRAVIDTSVFVAGLYWQGSARECLVRFALREFQWFATSVVLQEFAETAWELKIAEDLRQNPQPWLNWVEHRVTLLAPVPLSEPVSADPADDKFIECGLAARAHYIVSRDRHLLRLGKPSGIAVVDDRGFLARLERVSPK